jgi:soluble lytic murein transglycosylase-like protein
MHPQFEPMITIAFPVQATAYPVRDSSGRILWEMRPMPGCARAGSRFTERWGANGIGDGRFVRRMARLLISRSGARALFVVACFALSFATAPARADVLEVSPGRARWIVGAAPNASTVSPQQGSVSLADDAVVTSSGNTVAVPSAYSAKVRELAGRFDLSPALIEALVWQESRWQADARSPAGARGLTQLMPGTAKDLGIDPADPLSNLEGGMRYLRQQLDRFDGDLEKALAAYNAGPGRVEQAGGIPAIRETRTYVASVMGRLSDYSRRSQ